MTLISYKTNQGTVINLKGLITQMEELEIQHRKQIGEMHYSTCCIALLESLKEFNKK